MFRRRRETSKGNGEMAKESKEIPQSRDNVISIIGPGMRVVGDCDTDGTLRVEGTVEGTVRAAKAVVIGKDGIATEGSPYSMLTRTSPPSRSTRGAVGGYSTALSAATGRAPCAASLGGKKRVRHRDIRHDQELELQLGVVVGRAA